jgi:alkanesulfonate monooxygenase SsuD/methylene tetrahydromethanopterin reductase-like flavin-dependent oxidoreductase (luciferase family)
MRISANVTNYSWPEGPAGLARQLTDLARAAEAGGLDTLWINDHLLQADPTAAPGERDMLEAYTALGYVAGATERIRLGAMVTAVSYRAPVLLVKAVTTLDVLSGGRAWLGVGAGYPGEAERLALPLPPTAERFDLLADTVALARHMWTGQTGPFTGTRLTVPDPECVPAPLTPGGVPILVGGAGERKTLRLVAEYGDACNLFDIPDGGVTLRHKLDVLRRHCDDVGRDYESIDRTVSTRLGPDESAEDFARRCTQLAEWGLGHAVVITPGAWTTDQLTILSRAAELVRGI